jgi:putative oxidoreductase
MKFSSQFVESKGSEAVVLVRTITGVVFLLEGILKFLDPVNLGAGRFAKIGLPAPEFLAHFDGSFEILCGILLIVGLLTRLAAIPMIINMLVALVSTKLPMLMQAGFWKAAHESRLDFTMLFCCLFLVRVGAGNLSIDALRKLSKGNFEGSGRAAAKIAVIAFALIIPLNLQGAGSGPISVSAGQKSPAIDSYNTGVRNLRRHNLTAAKAAFEQALELDKNLAEAHNNLGYVLRKLGSKNYQASLEHYNTAISLKPNLAEPYMYRGVLFLLLGRRQDANQDYEKLRKLNPRLAKELEEVLRTGKEDDDENYGLANEL